MKTFAVCLVVLSLCCPGLRAQTAIPDATFESWTSAGLFEEPSSSWWASLNSLMSLGGPQTVTKSTDAHGGQFSARMETKSFGTLLVPGLLLSGEFDVNFSPTFLRQGKPWTTSPQRFQGWYKYTSVNGDSGAVVCRLTRQNGGVREIIGEAAMTMTSTVSAWTYFDLPIIPLVQGATPDSILVVLVSSAEGQNFQGQVGSTLWVDDLNLDFTTAADAPALEDGLGVWPVPAREALTIHTPFPAGALTLTDVQGRCLYSGSTATTETQLPVAHLAPGIYLLTYAYADTRLTRKVQILP